MDVDRNNDLVQDFYDIEADIYESLALRRTLIWIIPLSRTSEA